MFEITDFKTYSKDLALKLYTLWNDEYEFIFPITSDLFLRNTYGTNGFLETNSYVALNGDEPVGFIISKVWGSYIHEEENKTLGWISLIFVKSAYRKRGIGSALLEKSESVFKEMGITTYFIGKDYQNFFPGLPKDLKANLGWFSKRGFEALYETNDLINLNLNRFNMSLKPYHDNREYDIHVATKDEFPQIRTFFANSFYGRWLLEFEDYVKNGGNGSEFIVCTNSLHEVVGFCRIGTNTTPITQIGFSLTWRARFLRLGGFGPLGVSKDYRHNNIAYNLLVTGLLTLKERGCDCAIIDWTNLLDFYRMFGFELWKSYTYLQKNL